MRLIGITTSPYVRRTAISLQLLELPFTLEPLSTFANFEEFQQLNPVAKAPTLICENGGVLMDSCLILQFAEMSLAEGRSLWPTSTTAQQQDFSIVSLALMACDKAVQIIYEVQLRPEEARAPKLLQRFTGQAKAAMAGLEQAIAQRSAVDIKRLYQADISAAVAWRFIHHSLADLFAAADYPALVQLSKALEAHPVFIHYDLPGQ